VCYLQDLFVDHAARASGIGQQMIDWLIAECKTHHWSALYWNTRETNYRARALYDKFTPQSGFLVYRIQGRFEVASIAYIVYGIMYTIMQTSL
jgi:ribosomal protein S18 acetylase RimI-like enzyme